jgi:hypothetical protein
MGVSDRSIEQRIELMELAMDELKELPGKVDALAASVAALSAQFLQSRDDTRGEFVAIRDEMGGEFEVVRGEMRGEFEAVRGEMRGEFEAVRGEMRGEFEAVRGEMRGEFEAVRGEMRGEFADVRGEMRGEFAAVRQEIAAVDTRLRADTHRWGEATRAQFSEVHARFDQLRNDVQLMNEALFDRITVLIRG